MLAVGGAGLHKPLNRSVVFFTLMESGFVISSLLLRLSLYFHARAG